MGFSFDTLSAAQSGTLPDLEDDEFESTVSVRAEST
jgi:hypothetical protein